MSVNVTLPTFATNPNAAQAFYHEFGYCVEPEVLSHVQCDALIKAAQRLPSYQEGALTPVMNPHRLVPDFLQTLRNAVIVKLMEELLAGKVNGLQTQFFFCRPGTPGFTLHQDNYYVQSNPDAFASAWVALEDVSPDNGGLVVYPGTHREPILPVEDVEQSDNLGQDPNANRRQTILPKHYQPLDLCVPKGAAVILHGHLVHKSHRNTSRDRFRHALLMLYLRKGSPFRPGFAAGRTEIELYD